MGYKEDLMDEHRTIERGIAIVGAMRGRIEGGDPVPLADVERIVDFVRGFADQCHHHKEEKLLFPAMEAAGVQNEGGPIGELLTEHDAGRAYVAQLWGAVGHSTGDILIADRNVTQVMAAYASLLTAHIRTEDQETFPLADRVLSDAVKAKLAEQFDEYEREVLGGGAHERYLASLEQLEQAYGLPVLAS